MHHLDRLGSAPIKCLWALLSSITILSGCTVRNVDENATLNPDAADGIMVVSVSHDDEAGRGIYASFGLDEEGNLVSLKEVVPGIPGGSEFEEVYGELYVVRLPAGEHRITGWSLHSKSGIHVRPKQQPAPLAFMIRPGQVTYIGNLHMLVATGENIFGMNILGTGHPLIQDMRQRDLAVLDENYPNLAGKAVVELIPLGPWPAVREAVDRYVDPPPPVYIPKTIR